MDAYSVYQRLAALTGIETRDCSAGFTDTSLSNIHISATFTRVLAFLSRPLVLDGDRDTPRGTFGRAAVDFLNTHVYVDGDRRRKFGQHHRTKERCVCLITCSSCCWSSHNQLMLSPIGRHTCPSTSSSSTRTDPNVYWMSYHHLFRLIVYLCWETTKTVAGAGDVVPAVLYQYVTLFFEKAAYFKLKAPSSAFVHNEELLCDFFSHTRKSVNNAPVDYREVDTRLTLVTTVSVLCDHLLHRYVLNSVEFSPSHQQELKKRRIGMLMYLIDAVLNDTSASKEECITQRYTAFTRSSTLVPIEWKSGRLNDIVQQVKTILHSDGFDMQVDGLTVMTLLDLFKLVTQLPRPRSRDEVVNRQMDTSMKAIKQLHASYYTMTPVDEDVFKKHLLFNMFHLVLIAHYSKLRQSRAAFSSIPFTEVFGSELRTIHVDTFDVKGISSWALQEILHDHYTWIHDSLFTTPDQTKNIHARIMRQGAAGFMKGVMYNRVERTRQRLKNPRDLRCGDQFLVTYIDSTSCYLSWDRDAHELFNIIGAALACRTSSEFGGPSPVERDSFIASICGDIDFNKKLGNLLVWAGCVCNEVAPPDAFGVIANRIIDAFGVWRLMLVLQILMGERPRAYRDIDIDDATHVSKLLLLLKGVPIYRASAQILLFPMNKWYIIAQSHNILISTCAAIATMARSTGDMKHFQSLPPRVKLLAEEHDRLNPEQRCTDTAAGFIVDKGCYDTSNGSEFDNKQWVCIEFTEAEKMSYMDAIQTLCVINEHTISAAREQTIASCLGFISIQMPHLDATVIDKVFGFTTNESHYNDWYPRHDRRVVIEDEDEAGYFAAEHPHHTHNTSHRRIRPASDIRMSSPYYLTTHRTIQTMTWLTLFLCGKGADGANPFLAYDKTRPETFTSTKPTCFMSHLSFISSSGEDTDPEHVNFAHFATIVNVCMRRRRKPCVGVMPSLNDQAVDLQTHLFTYDDFERGGTVSPFLLHLLTYFSMSRSDPRCKAINNKIAILHKMQQEEVARITAQNTEHNNGLTAESVYALTEIARFSPTPNDNQENEGEYGSTNNGEVDREIADSPAYQPKSPVYCVTPIPEEEEAVIDNRPPPINTLQSFSSSPDPSPPNHQYNNNNNNQHSRRNSDRSSYKSPRHNSRNARNNAQNQYNKKPYYTTTATNNYNNNAYSSSSSSSYETHYPPRTSDVYLSHIQPHDSQHSPASPVSMHQQPPTPAIASISNLLGSIGQHINVNVSTTTYAAGYNVYKPPIQSNYITPSAPKQCNRHQVYGCSICFNGSKDVVDDDDEINDETNTQEVGEYDPANPAPPPSSPLWHYQPITPPPPPTEEQQPHSETPDVDSTLLEPNYSVTSNPMPSPSSPVPLQQIQSPPSVAAVAPVTPPRHQNTSVLFVKPKRRSTSAAVASDNNEMETEQTTITKTTAVPTVNLFAKKPKANKKKV